MRAFARLGDDEKRLLLDVARSLTANGLAQWACVREIIWLLLERRVEVWDGRSKVQARRLALCYRWAEFNSDRLVAGSRLSASQRKSLLNLARTFVGGNVASVNVRQSFGERLTTGRRIECRGRYGAAAVVGAPIRPIHVASTVRARGRRRGGEPDYLTGLPAAPVLPEPVTEWELVDGEWHSFVHCDWRSSHRWYRRGSARVERDRSTELDALLVELEPLVAARGWEEMAFTPTLVRGKSQVAGAVPGPGRELVLGVKDRRVSCRSDRLWRISKRHLYALLRRERLAWPEEVFALLGLPPHHVMLDRLAPLVRPISVVRAATQAAHGAHVFDVADLFAAVASVDDRRVRAMFVACGVNMVAMGLDERLGADGWDYVARVEANPHMAYMHDIAWAGRGFVSLERAEDEVRLPEGVAAPTEVCITMRCQPWSWLCLNGVSQLEKAAAERAAAYRSVRALDPDIVVDEMLSRSRMGGKAVAWDRVEYLREVIFDGMVWFMLDSDPGDEESAWSRSRRELAVGVKPRFVSVVRAAILSAGYVLGRR